MCPQMINPDVGHFNAGNIIQKTGRSVQGHTSERELHKLAKHLVFDPHDKETIFNERAAKMLTQLFLGVCSGYG